jgi:predicted RNase H-like HicB family nuclease
VSLVPEQLDLTIVYEPGEDGWIVVSIPEVPGVFSQGRTRDEARENVIDALRLMLSPEPRSADDQREREALHLTIAICALKVAVRPARAATTVAGLVHRALTR